MWQTPSKPDYDIEIEIKSEVAIYVLSRSRGEGVDRSMADGDIELSKTEIRDILNLNRQYKKFILVLNVGGIIDLTPVLEVDTILLMSQLGTTSGDSLADVTFRKAYPSGKLAASWAPIMNYPSTKGFGELDDTYYNEGIYVGYRYFDTVNYNPTFHFGFGLGYTQFKIINTNIKADEKYIFIESVVKNIGKYSGKEIVQVYISAPQTILDKPYQELKGYAKTKELLPDQVEILSIVISTESLASFDTLKIIMYNGSRQIYSSFRYFITRYKDYCNINIGYKC
jgi:glucosidase (fragment)